MNSRQKSPTAVIVAVILLAVFFPLLGFILPILAAGAFGYVLYRLARKQRREENARTGETIPVLNEDEQSLYSESEQLHLGSLGGDHNERAHRMLELKDLLNAGIIDQAEYRERLEQIRREA